MVLGLRGSTLPQGRAGSAGGPLPGAAAGVRTCVVARSSALKQQPGELRGEHLRHRESRYEPCEPSTSSLADFGARVTLERLYTWKEVDGAFGEAAHGTFFVTVDDRPQRTRNQDRADDYFANVGDAIRSLREDIPELFQREFNYGIYRDDIVFRDPRNCFKGMKNYQLIFWSLRFHGKLFFNRLSVDVKRIWQPEDGVIKMRWTVHGVPRVPWEAEGTFDGISTYRLDSHGKIYEHSVDNILLRDPPMATNPPLLAGLNLQPLVPSQQPVPGAWCRSCRGPEASAGRWGVLQRLASAALHRLDPEPEQQPAAAMAGIPVSSAAQEPQATSAAGPCSALRASSVLCASEPVQGPAGVQRLRGGGGGQGSCGRRR